MNDSIKLKMLAGLPLKFEDICTLYPLKLIDIVEIGYDKYNYFLNILMAEPIQFGIPQEYIEEKNLETFDIINEYLNFGTDEYKELLCSALSLFVRDEISFGNGEIFIGDISQCKTLNKQNYEKFKELLKIQNCVQKSKQEESEFNPANSKAEEIRQKILKSRSKVKKSQVEFSDLVSVLASCSNNLNIKDVWDLTMYQFNDQFKRNRFIEDFKQGYQCLLAGAKSEEVNLKYYIRPIDDE